MGPRSSAADVGCEGARYRWWPWLRGSRPRPCNPAKRRQPKGLILATVLAGERTVYRSALAAGFAANAGWGRSAALRTPSVLRLRRWMQGELAAHARRERSGAATRGRTADQSARSSHSGQGQALTAVARKLAILVYRSLQDGLVLRRLRHGPRVSASTWPTLRPARSAREPYLRRRRC